MRLAIAGDSAGQPLVMVLMAHFRGLEGLEVADLSHDGSGEFYADLAGRVARAVLDGAYGRAVLVCGTGIGVCISANKVPGIRAALTHDTYSAERAALSNNAQIITMGARVIGPELAKAIVAAWLPLEFDAKGRSAGNVAAIDALDARYNRL
ncbi:MAG: RpiB/LacA/LacB family sugar-phosphate isomerase [Rhodobacter sp.]|nr:RpiB/LacA/LacB family sugar-phosphate isomerase [Rhodobacter sp.]